MGKLDDFGAANELFGAATSLSNGNEPNTDPDDMVHVPRPSSSTSAWGVCARELGDGESEYQKLERGSRRPVIRSTSVFSGTAGVEHDEDAGVSVPSG